MTDPDQQALLNDLWSEDEAALRETSLQRMIAEGRQRRHQRGLIKAALAAAAMIAGGFWLWPPRPLPPAPEAPRHLIVRHLTQAEARDRLSGFAVAYAGSPGSRKIVLLEPSEK